jgi:hypothetical protein
LEFQVPLSGPLFVFGMSDMQFCKAQLRAVKAKPTDWISVLRALAPGLGLRRDRPQQPGANRRLSPDPHEHREK